MKTKRRTTAALKPAYSNKQITIGLLLVITVTTTSVIAAAAASGSGPSQVDKAPIASVEQAEKIEKSEKSEPLKQAAPASEVLEQRRKEPEAPSVAISEPAQKSANEQKAEPAALAPKSAAPPASEQPADGKQAAEAKADSNSEASRRKARAEQAAASSTASSSSAPAPTSSESKPDAKSASSEKPKSSSESKSSQKQQASKQQLSGKSGPKSKLPPNLGTVTSTGSGGHYMSKHDAYSAIAEKHGALAQDAMKKSDKRQLQGFGGIQKASGLGDVLSPFKGVTDSGLARTLGASMRSIMKSKYSVPAYVASALLGAVALMAFYESPISPLPVPPLPEPPVGRFPPEMPNLAPNTQVPFRTNQQQYAQNYNQRSLNMPQSAGYFNQQGQQQQVLFPGSNAGQQVAQQRSGQVSLAPAPGSAGGPVQQLAANLLTGKQAAQRKSSPDYDLSSRSFFSSAVNSISGGGSQKLAPSNSPNGPNVAQQVAHPKQQQGNSFLSYFGLGSASSSPSQPVAGNEQSSPIGQQQSSPQSSQMSNAANIERQGGSTAGGLSNSHLVNKVKSFFSRSPSSSGSSSSSSSGQGNPYEQYQRMSFVQALMKDTAFIPGFLAPTRKSSSPSSNANPSSQSSSASNKIRTITNALAASGNNPAARMQVGAVDELPISGGQQLQAAANSASRQSASGKQSQAAGNGLVRAADRIAHALLETFSSGLMQRSAGSAPASAPTYSSSSVDSAARKSGDESASAGSHSSSLASASSLISDLMSTYSAGGASLNAEQQVQSQPQQQQQQQQRQQSLEQGKSSSAQLQPLSSQQQAAPSQPTEESQLSGRSVDTPVSSAHSDEQSELQRIASSADKQQSAVAAPSGNGKQNNAALNQADGAHVRKTRSIGFEYPVESNQELTRREQQLSKAAQINNVIDFVADSYTQNRLLFNFVMNQVGLSQAVPYVEQILAPASGDHN